MRSTKLWLIISLLVMFSLIFSACAPTAAPTTAAPEETEEAAQPEETEEAAPTEEPVETEEPTPTEEVEATEEAAPAEEFVFGLLLVGPYNDHGWSQAHYEAGLYVEENLPGSRMVYIDKVNVADRPGTTPAQLADELVAQGAELVVFNSDDMKDSSTEFALANPEIMVVMASGDQVWEDGIEKDQIEETYGVSEIPNMVNVMGRMEYGKMMAGCAAALTTQTGQIGYLGPLINDETRRLAASAYLGAKYCWEEYLGNDPAELGFKVTWIGFWFNIPGFTSDPTLVADDFFNTGHDVVISGIDTTEGLQEAIKFADAGQEVWAIPYDFIGSCSEGPEVCLGVPYFNWGPSYLRHFTAAAEGTWESTFEWLPPDWEDLNNPDTTNVGFVQGDALPEEASAQLDEFIAELAGGLNLFTGPLNYQDESQFLAEGEVATDQQVWYLPQLLEGMEGQSVSAE
ncbi:MAG: BMP family ABC transporter substrate-binding protein [Chloroflexi bacterium]|nr:MAG: BMP family ABC transporter substrate-binding protein [Chloroflexota bacterium]